MPEAALVLGLTAALGWGAAGWALARRWRRAYLSALEVFAGLLHDAGEPAHEDRPA
jgi:hypothetical protein